MSPATGWHLLWMMWGSSHLNTNQQEGQGSMQRLWSIQTPWHRYPLWSLLTSCHLCWSLLTMWHGCRALQSWTTLCPC
ncbi:hypothetical protein A6R68_24285, partial [Neotoma lepida]